jgi:hypothetical protein
VRSINVLSAAIFESHYVPQTSILIRECDENDKLSIRELWRQLKIKMAIVVCFPVLHGFDTRGVFAGTQFSV